MPRRTRADEPPRRPRRARWALFLAAAALIGGCAATRPSTGRRPLTTIPPAPPAAAPIVPGELIAETCGLPTSTLFFAPDSADLDAGAAELVEAVAACLTRGPLEGRAIVLVAGSSPTGAPWFDALLRRARADSVANALMHAGVDPIRMAKLPLEEATNARDRRVEIRLSR